MVVRKWLSGNGRQVARLAEDATAIGARENVRSVCRMTLLTIFCLLGSLSVAEVVLNCAGKGKAGFVLDDPEVIESWSELKSDGLCTARYLFDSVVTNDLPCAHYKDSYVDRERGFVDLDQDGYEDVILSAPVTTRGTGGLAYRVYLWTNGLYRCIGDVGGSGIRVERTPQGSTAIWSYWHGSCRSGLFCRAELAQHGTFSETHLAVDWSGEGEPCIAKSLDDAITKYATVPIRWEISHTVNGTNVWCRMNR